MDQCGEAAGGGAMTPRRDRRASRATIAPGAAGRGLRAFLLAIALAPALLLPGGAARAQDSYGRLFFTPAQRALLDEARRRPPQVSVPAPAAPVSAPPPQSIVIDGVVRRADGRATVWVNKAPVEVPQRPGRTGALRIEALADAGAGVDLRLPDSRRSTRVRVGQQVDTGTGAVSERYRQPRPVPAAAPAMSAPGQDPASPSAEASAGLPGAGDGSAPGAGAPRGGARDPAVERALRALGRQLDDVGRALDRETAPATAAIPEAAARPR
jgi:hypothetical protein